MRRSVARFSWLATLAVGLPAHGITLYSTGAPSSHTTAPTGSFSNSGWNYEVQFVAGIPEIGTAIGPHAFITASHTVPTPGTTVNYAGNTYTVANVATTAIANREATVVTVSGGTLPYWAPIYSTTTDGSVVGKTSISFGNGSPGAAITVSTSRGTEGTLRGWQWGPDNGVQSWGTNVINNVFTDTSTPANNEYLQTTFDQNGLPDESTLSGGDSGGGTFVKGPDGVWKLAGVNSSVSPAAYALTQFPANPKSPLLGSAFDFSDLYLESNQTDSSGNPLYFQAQQFFPGQSPIPQTSSFSNISDIGAAALAAFVPHAGDVNADGKVNALDFNAIAAHFGMSSGAIWTQGDLNYDGKVNALDFTILANNFGYSGPVPGQILGADALGLAVPEPTSLALLALGGLALRRRRF